MSLVLPNVGEVKFLELALKDAAPNKQTLRLFVNNYIPNEDSELADFTEMSTQGYAAQDIARSSWTITTNPETGVTSATAPEKTFDFNGLGGATTVYGYYITTNDGSNKLLWAEKFDYEVEIRYAGEQIKLTPTINLS